MNAWLLLLRDLFLFRRGPADAPYAPMALATLFAIVLGFGMATNAVGTTTPQLHVVLIAEVIDLVLLNALLTVKGHQARFVQTATADLLVALPFTISIYAVLSFIGPLPNPVTPETVRPEHALLMPLVPLTFWWLGVRIRILSLALDTPPLRAFALLTLLWIAKMVLLTPFLAPVE